MNPRIPFIAAFVAGLLVLAWVGLGYLGSHPLALVVTLLIAAFYVMGAVELWRYRAATATLDHALAGGPSPAGASLADPASPATVEGDPAAWLNHVHPSLREPVRLRLDGVRAALPGPTLTPYLTGLLVLLGMLGTFLGLVVTLDGAVHALERTADLDAMRAALSAPVKGLGLAFGTSVAGVAASAMLGLMSAMARRERLQLSQQLDARLAGPLRPLSLGHRRDAAYRAIERQAEAMPALVAQMEAALARFDTHQQQLVERLVQGQAEFHGQARSSYDALAQSVDRTLRDSLTEAARAAGSALQPVAEATMARMAEQTTALHSQVQDDVNRQASALVDRLGSGVAALEAGWTAALDRHEQGSRAATEAQSGAMARVAEDFGRRTETLVEQVARSGESARTALTEAVARLADDTRAANAAQAAETRAAIVQLAEDTRTAIEALTTQTRSAIEAQAADTRRANQDLSTGTREASQALLADLRAAHESLSTDTLGAYQRLADTLSTQLKALADGVARSDAEAASRWQAAVEAQQGGIQTLNDTVTRTLAELGEQTRTAHTQLTDSTAAQLTALTEGLRRSTTEVADRWREAVAEQHQAGRALADTLQATQARLADSVGERSAQQAEHFAVQSAEQAEAYARRSAQQAEAFTERSAQLLAGIERAQQQLREDLAHRDESRQVSLADQLKTMAETLERGWREAGEAQARQQTALREALAEHAREVQTRADAQVQATVTEVARLMSTAAEAPRAAAEAMALLQRKLSDSVQQDNALLAERERLMGTLGGLLGGLQQAATDQRGAVDALVQSASGMLERVGERFAEQVNAEADRLRDASVQTASGAAEVAGLGEAFGAAVQQFGETSGALLDGLKRIEDALGQQMARSDDQLAYYVAQAREIVDLSLGAQRQIVDDLQRLAPTPEAVASAAVASEATVSTGGAA